MAGVKNGMVYSEEYMGYQYYFTWNVYGQDVDTGEKIVRWQLISACSGSYSRFSINLQLYDADDNLIETEGMSPWKDSFRYGEVIDSGEMKCPLETDKIMVNGYCYINAGIGLSIAGVWQLTTDYTPSPSSISCSTVSIGQAPTIAITKYDADTYVNITYTFGTLSGTIVEGYSGEVYNGWIIPDAFYDQMTDVSSKKGTLTAVSFRNGASTGTETCSFTVRVDTDECAPVVNVTIFDTNETTTSITKDNTFFVRGYSNATVTVEATANKGASIASYTIKNSGRLAQTARATFNGITSGDFLITVTDSRGVSTTTTMNVSLIDYIKTTCVVAATPPNAHGETTVSVSGIYFANPIGQTQNVLTVKYRHWKHGDTATTEWTPVTVTIEDGAYYAELPFEGLDYKSAHTFEAIATDLLSEATSKVSVKTVPVFSWSNDDFEFNVPVNVNGTVETDGMTVVGDSTFNGTTEFTGETTISGTFNLDADLEITKQFTVNDITVNNNETVGGDLTVTNKVTAGSITSNGALTAKGGATITGNVTVNGNLTANNIGDYVTENTEQTVDSWTWKVRKWNSGFVECWGKTGSVQVIQNEKKNVICYFPVNFPDYDYHLWISATRDYHAGDPNPVYGWDTLRNTGSTNLTLYYVDEQPNQYASQSVGVHVYLAGYIT